MGLTARMRFAKVPLTIVLNFGARRGLLTRLAAFAFGAATLLAPSGSFASTRLPAIDFSSAIAQVGETQTGDAVTDSESRRPGQFPGDDAGGQRPRRGHP